MRRRLALFVLFIATVAVACGGNEKSILDEGARFPDAEGVATLVTLERIEIDGSRSFEISDRVESFTTRSHEVTPLLSWKDKYVQIGVEDDVVSWVAGVGTVVKAKPPYTLYTGIFERFDGERRRAIFEDGTTLALADGVSSPNPGEVIVTIDPAKHVATKIETP